MRRLFPGTHYHFISHKSQIMSTFLWKSLNGGTVPLFSMHLGCTLPHYKFLDMMASHAFSCWLSALFACMPYNREKNEILVCTPKPATRGMASQHLQTFERGVAQNKRKYLRGVYLLQVLYLHLMTFYILPRNLFFTLQVFQLPHHVFNK